MEFRLRQRHIPWILAVGRALLAPVMLLGARSGWNGLVMAGMIVAALLSDIFDGVLARRWKCDTARLRLFDTMADTVFYLGVLIALWSARPALWASVQAGILALLIAEAANHGLALARFGKPPSYHSYLAKAWGLVLAATMMTAFAGGPAHWMAHWMMVASIAVGIACNVQGMAMTLILPEWRRDIRSIRVAWTVRGELLLAARGARRWRVPAAAATTLAQ